MSSNIYGEYTIAPAVSRASAAETSLKALGVVKAVAGAAGKAALLPAGLIWGSGHIIVSAVKDTAEELKQIKLKKQAAEQGRRRSAEGAYAEMIKLCGEIRTKLKNTYTDSGTAEFYIEKLDSIMSAAAPEDTEDIEAFTAASLKITEEIVNTEKKLSEIKLEDSYDKISVNKMLQMIKKTCKAAELKKTEVKDIAAPDPDAAERNRLSEELGQEIYNINTALEFTEKLAAAYPLPPHVNASLISVFAGLKEKTDRLYMPRTADDEIKQGIISLRESFTYFDKIIEGLAQEAAAYFRLYEEYRKNAEILGEKPVKYGAFRNSDEIAEKISDMEKRLERAKRCAELYRSMGEDAYVCYAVDCELIAAGYKVHTKKEAEELSSSEPVYAKSGERYMPFYNWGKNDLTQLYSLAEDCGLQVKVHRDGSISMQVFAEEANEKTVSVQKKHCEMLKKIAGNLKNLWFIDYGFTEEKDAGTVMTRSAWADASDKLWSGQDEEIPARRKEDKNTKAQSIE